MIARRGKGLFRTFRWVLERVEEQRKDTVVREALRWKLSKMGISYKFTEGLKEMYRGAKIG
jgi:hypothetical protein